MTKEASNTNTLKKEMWLHACAVVNNEEFPGLRSMIFSCYHYEKMMAEELDKNGSGSSKHASLLIAWTCIFFEVIRAICEEKYKKHASPCVLDRMKRLKKIKKKIVRVRSFLSKFKEDKSQQKDESQHKGKDKFLGLTPYCPYSFEIYVLAEETEEMIREKNFRRKESKRFPSMKTISEINKQEQSEKFRLRKTIRSINIKEQSEEFLLILSECEVPESSKHWLSKRKKNT